MQLKYLFLLAAFPLSAMEVAAQNVPNLGQTVNPGIFTNMDTPPEVQTGSGLLNSVTTLVPVLPTTDAASVTSGSPAANVRQQIVFMDGNQKPYQAIQQNVATVNGVPKNLIQIYDNRPLQETFSFLPYPSNSGSLRNTAFLEQRVYYNSVFAAEGYTSFSKKVNTSGPGERSTTGYLPGRAQVGLEYGSVSKVVTNPASQVIIWNIDGSGMPVAAGYYAAGMLSGVETADPDGAGSNFNATSPKARVYSDKEDKVILKLIADSSWSYVSGGVPYVGITYGYTYYVYDVKGNLRITITPKAYQKYLEQGSFNTTILNNLCYQYKYDAKERLIAMKKPGEGDFTYLVYDRKDRPVMRQTPNEKAAQEWEVTFMDVNGRIKVASIYKDVAGTPMDQAGWQNAMDTWTNGGTYADLLNYLTNPALESKYPVGDNPVNDLTNLAYTLVANNTVMSINYYDDYTKSDPAGTLFASCQSQVSLPSVTATGQEVPVQGRAYGLPTSSIVRILRAPAAATSTTVGDWRTMVTFYDDKGRVINTKSSVTDNINGHTVINTDYSGMQYDFAGKLLISGHVFTNILSENNILGATHSEYTKSQYDTYSGALIKTVHKVDNRPWVTLATYIYDAMGKLKSKTLGVGGEVQEMSYNIRGQLMGINGVYAETGQKGGYSKTFGESLKYDYGFTKPRYDGKLAGMVWRGSSGLDMYAYGYDYKQNGALKTADFNHIESGNWAHGTMDYSVSNLFYDKNGNMTSMKQRGVKPGTGAGTGPVDMDNLQYTYENSGLSNRLQEVGESGTAGDYGAGDFQLTTSNTYDANGNLYSTTGSKNIQFITYTRANKPQVIKFSSGSTIHYSYDAMGNIVEELSTNRTTGILKRTDYIGNAVYQYTTTIGLGTTGRTDTLQYLLTGDGRTTFNSGTQVPKEEFFVKDHLGNVRSVINVSGMDISSYLATYELASANLENLIFDNIEDIRDVRPGGDNDNSMAARLNGAESQHTIGTSLLMHVMAGDKVGMNVSTLYNGYDAGQDEPLNPEMILDNIIGTLTGGVGGLGGSESHDVKLVQDVFTQNNFSQFVDIVNTATDDSRPKAYLNYVLFDENMNLVREMSGAFQATGNGAWSQIGTSSAIEVPVNGYLAVYLSNASVNITCNVCADVYFDEMLVSVSHGNLLEENHYYPHGLPIFGLGSRTADVNYRNNRRKYQSNEYITDLGLNWMSFGARQYDPQIGRFLSVDPLAALGGQDSYSPYVAMGNQPESNVDPNGMAPGISLAGINVTAANAYGGESGGGPASASWYSMSAGGDYGMSYALRAFGNVIDILGDDNILTARSMFKDGASARTVANDYKNKSGAFDKHKQKGVGGIFAAYNENSSLLASANPGGDPSPDPQTGGMSFYTNKGKKINIASFQLLWDSYPVDQNGQPLKLQGYENECAIRMSYVLWLNGTDISSAKDNFSTSQAGFIRRASDFGQWLSEEFGPPVQGTAVSKYNGQKVMTSQEFQKGRYQFTNGIIYIEFTYGSENQGTGHVDLWRNNISTRTPHALLYPYAESRGVKIWFWPIK